MLPFLFARALMAEGIGAEISWAEYAFKFIHPHQSRSGIPRVLPEFANITEPLHPLTKVIPSPSTDQILYPVPLPEPDREENVDTPAPPIDITEVEASMENMHTTLPTNGVIPASSAPTVTVDRPEPSVMCEVGESPVRHVQPLLHAETERMAYMLSKVMPRLCLIREGLTSQINSERMKLKESRHLAFAGVSNCKERIFLELDRQRFVERRLSEVSEVHAEAAEDYERARLNCVAAKRGLNMCTVASEKATRADILSNAEALVQSWFETMDSAKHRRRAWEFKANHQASIVNKLGVELVAAEEKYRKTREEIDADLAHLVAVAELLERVNTRSQACL
ncbi:hypothetical protein M758_UG010100 [Ceratodon purpureus]|nr:hypothetical protein M758_UG010100 [Ceratodon purpureus]